MAIAGPGSETGRSLEQPSIGSTERVLATHRSSETSGHPADHSDADDRPTDRTYPQRDRSGHRQRSANSSQSRPAYPSAGFRYRRLDLVLGVGNLIVRH